MTKKVNLLPIANRRATEHRLQMRRWCAIWLLTILGFTCWYELAEQRRHQLNQQLDAAMNSIAPVHFAEVEISRLRRESKAFRDRALEAERLEQSAVPLALIQTVGECCHALGTELQIDSLRMDEAISSGNTSSKSAVIRKQLMIVGSSTIDGLITMLVARLNESRVFQKVELESSQAAGERGGAKRIFQIRCQQ